MKPLRYEKRDALAYLTVTAYLCIVLVCRWFLPWPM